MRRDLSRVASFGAACPIHTTVFSGIITTRSPDRRPQMMRIWRLVEAPKYSPPVWWMGHRAWAGSAQAEASGPSADQQSRLKEALRQLYKLVHPDLFSDNLVAKASGLDGSAALCMAGSVVRPTSVDLAHASKRCRTRMRDRSSFSRNTLSRQNQSTLGPLPAPPSPFHST